MHEPLAPCWPQHRPHLLVQEGTAVQICLRVAFLNRSVMIFSLFLFRSLCENQPAAERKEAEEEEDDGEEEHFESVLQRVLQLRDSS